MTGRLAPRSGDATAVVPRGPAIADRPDRGPAMAAMARDYPAGYRIPPHRHRRSQLVYAASGVLRVSTPDGTWIIPPQRAVWVPAGIVHRLAMVGNVALRTLYLRASVCGGMPDHCAVVEVRPLLRELILAMIEIEDRAPGDGAAAAAWRHRRSLLTGLIQDELRAVPVVPLRIPMPRDRRLLRLCEAVLEAPGSDRSLDAWGLEVGASARTLARLARRELGMTFGAWRQQVRLAEAVSQIALGMPVTEAARAAGYANASAFSAMFRRALGTTPTDYLRDQ